MLRLIITLNVKPDTIADRLIRTLTDEQITDYLRQEYAEDGDIVTRAIVVESVIVQGRR